MDEFIANTDGIDRVLELLFGKCDEKSFEQICNILDEVYLDSEGNPAANFRHQYSAISGKLNELRNTEADFVKTYGLDIISSNVEELYEYARNNKKPYLKNLFKLKDHIGLEIGRIEYTNEIRDKIMSQSERIKELKGQYSESERLLKKNKEISDCVVKQADEIAELLTKSQESLDESKKMTNNVAKLVKKEKQKLENIQKDYIAILGILSAILITFTSGSIFSSSVLANLHQSSIYRILFICLILGLVLVNAVALLMQYVKWIIQIEKGKMEFPPILIIFNILVINLMVLVVIAWFFDIRRFADYIQSWVY